MGRKKFGTNKKATLTRVADGTFRRWVDPPEVEKPNVDDAFLGL